jgi:hypothetical protein
MKKLIISLSFLLNCLTATANNNVSIGPSKEILLLFGFMALLSALNFVLCMVNMPSKSRGIRIVNFILLIPFLVIIGIAFFLSPPWGFIACFILLLKGIFIYYGFPRTKNLE